MLVLSRKIGERIHIGNDITVEIRRVAGNRVTLALDAPRNVRILRGELEQSVREFRDSSQVQDHDHEVEVEVATTGGFQLVGDLTSANDTTGPEPYAVIHRRMQAVPQHSPQSVPQPAAS